MIVETFTFSMIQILIVLAHLTRKRMDRNFIITSYLPYVKEIHISYIEICIIALSELAP